MAFGDVVQSNTGTSTTATTSPTLPSGVTAGNLIVLQFAADDYNGTPNAGWTQSTGMEQQTFHGGYLWWFIAGSNGQAIPGYTIASAVRSHWALVEYAGPFDASPYDVSNGVCINSAVITYATPTITPSAGDRLLVAGVNFQMASTDIGVAGSWTNSFTQVSSTVFNGGNPRLAVGQAKRVVTANGSTGYSTAATLSTSQVAQSESGLIIAFKMAEGGEEPVDGAVTSVAATATALAVAPAASGVEVTNGEVTAVVATATAQAEVPVVTGEALVEGGGPATASAEAKAPTVSAVRNASVTGVAATGSAGAASPVVSAVGAGAVISVAATATAQAAAPSVSAVRNASATGVKATATSAAQAPAVAGVRNAAVAAAVATATALANEVAASGVTSGPQAAPVATATAQFHAPVVSAFLTGGVTAVAASATAEAGEPAAEGVIVITFRPPTHSVRFASVENDRLFGRMSTQVGYAVLLRKDGTYEMTRFIDPDRTDVEKVYGGGRVNVLTEDEADALTEAGYGQYIQPPR